MALDLASLWDFAKPEASEARFRQALATATGDDALILETQIARTYGLRRDFTRAREILQQIEPKLATAGPEAQTRYWLELGRTYASATHTSEALTPEAKQQARAAYQRALALSRTARLDGLAIDALHMFAFVDSALADQLKWGQEALAVATASSQPEAKRWEASIRNNIGYALHQQGRYREALDEFTRALKLREQTANPHALRAAKWMVAWTLRALDRTDEALEQQLALERDADAVRDPDPYVFEELEILYRARGDEARAKHYAERKREIQAQAAP